MRFLLALLGISTAGILFVLYWPIDEETRQNRRLPDWDALRSQPHIPLDV